eukprot:CAMPEP_0174305092 /NCGR_PEP_ID=MMETSP0809-20121228/61203_1 /TAXON_ID=73025 ORGANISM="Eutreptiella gymnastica-like, Strain CCMP1594" /NCGR_SAMPLE_ID=MMETSP0809 /ASSEMBLY_ACC=CAM_ASM_000658 /LENGTH=138 /DNA_ID=CAMNT_0015411499 /DNA_START=26 /DNA_END=442 /DNA_ORIENTATION=+
MSMPFGPGGRAQGRGGKKGGRKGKQNRPPDMGAREVAWGQNAYFPEPTEGTMGALEGELEDGLLEYEGDYGGGQRMIFDLTEALELMDERWQECIAHANLERVPQTNVKVNPKFNITKEIAKVVNQSRQGSADPAMGE